MFTKEHFYEKCFPKQKKINEIFADLFNDCFRGRQLDSCISSSIKSAVICSFDMKEIWSYTDTVLEKNEYF